MYLHLLFRYAKAYRLRIWAYCLMTNHIHVVGVPEREASLARVFGRLHADYARAVNARVTSGNSPWRFRPSLPGPRP